MDHDIQTVPPVVILARPQMGENIGAAARAMMNCGLSDLRLVAPRDGWPNATALPMAAGGKSIIEHARVFDTVAAATHDVSFLAATSARRRDLAIRSSDPRHAAAMIVAHTSQSHGKAASDRKCAAILFGPEASGLDNDEVVLADILVTASLNPDYPSLNLAQGVLLLAWEWRMAAQRAAGGNVLGAPAVRGGPQPLLAPPWLLLHSGWTHSWSLCEPVLALAQTPEAISLCFEENCRKRS